MKKILDKNKWINSDTDGLFNAVLKLENLDEAKRFFRDLLTEKEIIEFGQRWKVARLLAKNKKYTEIEKETRMSSKTIARIQKWLTEGMGGYRLMIERLKRNNDK
jgi:TrpR-related protein YerC/YecD